MQTQKKHISFFILSIILLIIFTFNFPIEAKAFCSILLAFMIIYLGIGYFHISVGINVFLLLYLPFLLEKNNYIFLSEDKTYPLFIILVVVFITTIINFLVLSFNIQASLFGIKKPLLKIIAIFTMYIALIYSVLNCFAILYIYLGNVFNEGIVGEGQTMSYLDALYFSTTTFFTIGLGDIHPSEYSEITKRLVIIQAVASHIITVVLWPVAIIFLFDRGKYTLKKSK